MDCLEFRRTLAAMPHAREPAMDAHRRQCPACQAAWEQAQRFEEELLGALQVPAPEGLAERIVLAQTTGRRQRHAHGRHTFMALAASLLVALGLGAAAWQQIDARSLPALAVAHMPPEIASLDLTRPISPRAVATGFASRDLPLPGPVPADTTYVHDCMVGPYQAMHMVTRRNGEPVVVLYLPHKPVARTRNFVRHGWVGREMPLGQGSLVLLSHGGTRAPFQAVAASWRHAIEGTHLSQSRTPLAP